MSDSILDSIKKMLGLDEEYDVFDTDLIILINSVLFSLNQMGIGPNKPLIVTDSGNEWSEFTEDFNDLEAVKTYIYLRVKLLFDPPTSSAVQEAMNKTIDELQWRLYSRKDYSTGEMIDS